MIKKKHFSILFDVDVRLIGRRRSSWKGCVVIGRDTCNLNLYADHGRATNKDFILIMGFLKWEEKPLELENI